MGSEGRGEGKWGEGEKDPYKEWVNEGGACLAKEGLEASILPHRGPVKEHQ